MVESFRPGWVSIETNVRLWSFTNDLTGDHLFFARKREIFHNHASSFKQIEVSPFCLCGRFFRLVALTDRFVMNNRASKNIGLRRNNKLWLDTIMERCAFVPQCWLWFFRFCLWFKTSVYNHLVLISFCWM